MRLLPVFLVVSDLGGGASGGQSSFMGWGGGGAQSILRRLYDVTNILTFLSCLLLRYLRLVSSEKIFCGWS